MIEVRIDDLAFVQCDAIARPATSRLAATTPLMRRLETAAGPGFAAHLSVQEPLAVGSAIVTPGGELAAGLVIHAVISSDEEPVSVSSVRRATASALQRAEAWRVAHVAIAPFGLGAGNLDVEGSAKAMSEAIVEHFARASFPSTLTVIAETAEEADRFSDRLGQVSR